MSPATLDRRLVQHALRAVRARARASIQTTAPTMTILSMPLTRLVMPSMPNMPLEAASGDSLEKSGLMRSGVKTRPVLDEMAAERRRATRSPNSGPRMTRARRSVLAHQRHMPPGSTLNLIGLFEEDAEVRREAFAADDWPNMAMASVPPASTMKVDTSVALDDVAVVWRLVEPSLCRFFGLLGVVAIVGHGGYEKLRHLCGVVIRGTPSSSSRAAA